MLVIPPSQFIFPPWQLVVSGLLVVVGLGGAVGSVWWMSQHSTDSCLTQPAPESASPSAHLSAQKTTIFIDVAGAVVKPGMYALESGDRVAQAIEKAGGFGKTADTQYISQELNLAKVLKDGDKLYVYTKQEAQQKRQSTSAPATNESTSSTSPTNSSQQVSLNTATQKELESLAGIGEKRAADIVAGRPFTSIDDLVSKKLVSEAVFTEIKPFLKL